MSTVLVRALTAGLLSLGANAALAQPADCLTLLDEAEMSRALRGLKLSSANEARPLQDIRILGLRHVEERQIWELYGGKPETPTIENAAALLRRLSRLGLFATVNVGVQVESGGSVIEFELVEHPVLRKVEIGGLSDAARGDLLDAVLAAPPPRTREECPTAPPPEWVARFDRDELAPGVLWKGLPGAVDRAVSHLFSEGYEMARLEGALLSDGTLKLDVDEGRIDSFEIRGVEPALEAKVRKRLGVEAGEVFLASDLDHGMKRVHEEFPFLSRDDDDRWTRARPEVSIESVPAGESRFRTVEARCEGAGAGSRFDGRRGCWNPSSFYVVDDRRLVVYLKVRRGQFRLQVKDTDVLRHTRVTGYAPGISLENHVWDPLDRAHFALDSGISLNTGRRSRNAPESGFLEGLSASERIDWYVGPRVRLPALEISEIGVQLHAFSDTSDMWRRSQLDAYLASLFGTGSGLDFYRRAGVTSFVTFRAVDRLVAGVEHRLDRYDSLASLGGQIANPAVDAGRMGSLLFRLEWSSEPRSEPRLASRWRHPEAPLYGGIESELVTGFRTLNTLEVARPGLGGDARFDFTRFVSDNVVTIASDSRHGLRLRLRAAGGRDLPLQKQEALGGWSALRGYDFKEFRGSYSLLGMAEYRFDLLSFFADVGSVKQDASWTGAKLGVGAAFNFGSFAQLAFAWRTDDRGDASPRIRVVFGRAF
jgi:hypothetical protein